MASVLRSPQEAKWFFAPHFAEENLQSSRCIESNRIESNRITADLFILYLRDLVWFDNVTMSDEAPKMFPRGSSGPGGSSVSKPAASSSSSGSKRKTTASGKNHLSALRVAAGEDDEDNGLDFLRASKKRKKGSFESGSAVLSVDDLTFKKLAVGMKLLGAVTSVRSSHITVSLPFGLKGSVAREEVSDELYEDSDLAISVKLGAYIPCQITALGKTKKGAHQIDLSCRASVINENIGSQMFLGSNVVFGSIKSAEDYGYVVNFGTNITTGFLKYRDGESLANGTLQRQIGEPLYALIDQVATGKKQKKKKKAEDAVVSRVVQLVDATDRLGSTSAKNDHSSRPSYTFQNLLPGTLVSANCKQVGKGGIVVKFLGGFDANLTVSHFSEAAFKGWEGEYQELSSVSTLKARVLCVDPESKRINVSVAPHIVAMHDSRDGAVVSHPSIGSVVDVAVVRRIDPGRGMLLELTLPESMTDGDEAPAATRFAYVRAHEAFERADGKGGAKVASTKQRLEKVFKIDSRYKCRIIGYSPIDNTLSASLRPSVVEATVMRYDQLEPSMDVRCTVTKVDSFGVLVDLGNGLQGIVTNMHLSDVEVREPKKHFRVGQVIRCKVLQLDEEKRGRVMLTHKRTILRSKLTTITAYQGLEINTVAHGFVTKAENYGVIVTFFNNVHGLVPADLLSTDGVADPAAVYKVSIIAFFFFCVFSSSALSYFFHALVRTPPRIRLDTSVGGGLLRAWYINGLRSALERRRASPGCCSF